MYFDTYLVSVITIWNYWAYNHPLTILWYSWNSLCRLTKWGSHWLYFLNYLLAVYFINNFVWGNSYTKPRLHPQKSNFFQISLISKWDLNIIMSILIVPWNFLSSIIKCLYIKWMWLSKLHNFIMWRITQAFWIAQLSLW